MNVENQQPLYMVKLLEELGWNQGTRIPLANPQNQELENILIARQNEIQRLKEAISAQTLKRKDLDNYKAHVVTEYQENTRLLFAQKHQLEQEVKLRQIAVNEANLIEREITICQKKIKELNTHIDRHQGEIARLLKRADELKSEVCDERVALQDWRAAIERGASDIDAIERFTKQDVSKAKTLELQRQRLKVEHDKMQNQLAQLVTNLAAEERACERISQQVIEGIEQRKQMMRMWSAAVENLRQRDADIRHIKEDYEVLEKDANRIAEECREQQAFFAQQKGNNEEAEKENAMLSRRIGDMRVAVNRMHESNITLDSEAKSLSRSLVSCQHQLDKLRAENRSIMEEQHKKDTMLSEIQQKCRELKASLAESQDKTKSSEKRAKQLEEMLTEEERYASNLTVNQQRAMHCSYNEQQKLLVLKNEEKLCEMQLKSSKAIMSKLDQKEAEILKKMQSLKESIYTICYQVETVGAKVMFMEGAQTERECQADLVHKENRLKEVLGRHAARVALLDRHSVRLQEDMHRVTRALEYETRKHARMHHKLKTAMLEVDGGEKELKLLRQAYHRDRVEEALLKLRVAHANRAVSNIEDANFNLDTQRLQLDAAMNERMVEIDTRRQMFLVQKRALIEDCSKLRVDIKERQNRVIQLIKRYEIFIASLGKDESGAEMSVAFFKIKFAAERAELRERGAALDAEVARAERDVSALEATMRVVAAAHSHFMHNLMPLPDESPEVREVSALTAKYYETVDELKAVRSRAGAHSGRVAALRHTRDLLADKNRQLVARASEAECELENARDRRQKQETQLENAREVVRLYTKRAKKLIEGVDLWRLFQLALWVRDYAEAAHNAINALDDLFTSDDSRARLGALLTSTDIQKFMDQSQRRLYMVVQRIIDDSGSTLKGHIEMNESVFSPSEESDRSAVSLASGYKQRFAAFRKTLARRVEEPTIVQTVTETAQRSAMSLRVVNLGMEDAPQLVPTQSVIGPTRSRRSFN